MEIKTQLTALALQVINTSQSILSYPELMNKMIDLHPEWLPGPIYNPQHKYQRGQRLFHASPKIEDWFTVEGVLSGIINVKFDHGKEMTLVHDGSPNTHFPTTQIEFIQTKIDQYNLEGYLLRLLKENSLQQACKAHTITDFYRIDLVDHLPGIFREGVICRNQVKISSDISDPEIQVGRHNKHVPCSPEHTLHDYVPVFFAPKPPMLSARREQQNDIVYLHLDPKILLLEGTVFTDGNARSNGTRFFHELADLDELNWHILRALYWNSDDPQEHYENKRARSAEILVPGKIPVEYIKMISVYDQSAFQQLSALLDKLNMQLPVKIDPSLYYPVWSRYKDGFQEAPHQISESLPTAYVPEPPPNFDDDDPYWIERTLGRH